MEIFHPLKMSDGFGPPPKLRCTATLPEGMCGKLAVYVSNIGFGRVACQECADRLGLAIGRFTKDEPAQGPGGAESFLAEMAKVRKPLIVIAESIAPSTVHPYREIVVVDDFYRDPERVRTFAMQQRFQREPVYHKCQRSPRYLFSGVKESFEQAIGAGVMHMADTGAMRSATIVDWGKYPTNGCFQLGVSGDEIVYHSDSQGWAGAVYLNPDPPLNSGTSFWRSKSTGLRYPPTQEDAERIGQERLLPLMATDIEKEMYEGKLLSAEHWDKLDEVANVFNRLVLWRGPLVHSVSSFFGTNKETGRLNQLFFFDVG